MTWKNSPKGQWLVLRLFAASTGGHTKHGRKETLGYECDKLSVDGARLQWESYVKPVIDTLRANNSLISGICMDSHEAGPQNWTSAMPPDFVIVSPKNFHRIGMLFSDDASLALLC